MVNVEIQEYSDKSFVVRGEGTRVLREDLKTLGGKWNSRLTDKETGDKFGAWLFWTEKREEIEMWITKGCRTAPKAENHSGLIRNVSKLGDSSTREQKLEKKVDELTHMVSLLCDHFGLVVQNGIQSDEDEDPPPRRLLQGRVK